MKNELWQGDCLELMKNIPDGSVDMIMTDPPYGTTACKWDSVIPLESMWRQLKRIIKPNGAIVIMASQPFTSVLITTNISMFKYCWIWVKNTSTAFQSAKYRPLQKHEDIVVFGKGKIVYYPQKTKGHKPTNSAKSCKQAGIYHGDATWEYKGGSTERFPVTVQQFNIERGLHPTQKPVALIEYFIKTYTKHHETVLDFTMGSGTTGVACWNLFRHFIGIELDQTYFDIAKKRIEGLERAV